MYWSARPFVRIFLFLATGILIAFNFDGLRAVPLFVYYGIIIFFLLIIFLLLKKRFSYSLHWIKGVFPALALITLGILISVLNFSPKITHSDLLHGTYAGLVDAQPVETGKVYKAVIKLKYRYDSINTPLSQKVLLYFEKTNDVPLRYGDEILFTTILKQPDLPSNPKEFNYKSFLKSKGIEWVGFVPANNYKITGNNPPNKIISFATSIRNKVLTALKEKGLSGEEYAVAAAIVLGYDDVMDDQIRENYQKAGAMHVLCVSGLHVGVIYLVLSMLLKFMNKSRWQIILKVIILLLSVWMYALLTGLAPSVMRATVMISFIIIGKEVERDKDAYNTLAMSAVFLLIYDPGFLFNVGFQLSYAAVLGIVTFYWPVYRLLYIKNIVLNKLWAASAISISAQLGTFPLAIHYFHFFPTWFLLSNIVILIFSNFIISMGMLFVIVSWIPVISEWIALLLSGLIYLMNYLVAHIGQLPFEGANDLYFPWIKVTIIYLILFTGYRMIVTRERSFIIPFLSMILLFSIYQVSYRYQVLKQNRVVIYNVGKKHSAIDFITGNQHLLLCDSLLINNQKQLNYYTENSRISWGLEKNRKPIDAVIDSKEAGLWSNGKLFLFNNLSILKIDSDDEFYPLQKPFTIDWIWITGKADMRKIMQTFSFNHIIIGQAVYPAVAKEITEELKASPILVYNINEKGALQINIR